MREKEGGENQFSLTSDGATNEGETNEEGTIRAGNK